MRLQPINEIEREKYGTKRVWKKCNHGTWLSPCPVCKEEKQVKKLLNSVTKLQKISKILHTAPLENFNNKSIVLLHIALELELERLSKIFNEISDKINSPIRIRIDEESK